MAAGKVVAMAVATREARRVERAADVETVMLALTSAMEARAARVARAAQEAQMEARALRKWRVVGALRSYSACSARKNAPSSCPNLNRLRASPPRLRLSRFQPGVTS